MIKKISFWEYLKYTFMNSFYSTYATRRKYEMYLGNNLPWDPAQYPQTIH